MKRTDLSSSVRRVREADIPAVVELYRLNYGDGYSHPEMMDAEWVRWAIYNDNFIWLLIEEDGLPVATGKLTLDYGDHNDQLGLISGLVAHPKRNGGGLGPGLAGYLLKALISAAEGSVECVIAFARTAHRASQKLAEGSNLIPVGFLPQYANVSKCYEDLVIYADLYGEGHQSRTYKLPQTIPEVAGIARHVLSSLNLQAAMGVVNDCPSYSSALSYTVKPANGHTLALLRRIERGRTSDPLLFGNLSLDYGTSLLSRKGVSYLMVVDGNLLPVGAIGYKSDPISKVFKIVELVFDSEEVIESLCASALRVAEHELGMRVVEADLSAYDARIQQTFFNFGFRPAAYVPAMVFHNTHRFDVVKMIKLNVPYDPGAMLLTRKANAVVSLVDRQFHTADGRSAGSAQGA